MKKLQKLRSERGPNNQTKSKNSGQDKSLPPVIHNFSTYILSDKEVRVLSKTLDHYIPSTNDKSKRTKVEFERFYNNILSRATKLDIEQKLQLKTSFLNTFNKFSKVKVSNDNKKVIENLYKNDKIAILRQDKGRGVVILNKTDYISKCETFLHGPEFEELVNDPTSTLQTHVQKTLREMKKKFSKAEYSRLYPSSSQPGLFFGLAKVHKLKEGQTDVNDLPLRPVISNIGTTTYQISKHLANWLAPLTKSKQNIESTKDFLSKLKKVKIKNGYKMVSLDVASLFTSVPLDYTINIILDKIYKDKLVKTCLTQTELKTLLELCTKEVHFTFNKKVYKQTNGVAMGSPLSPVLTNIFMVHLEEFMIPRLKEKMSLWYRYVDDTFTFIKEDEIENIQKTLNDFHPAIKFTYETEVNNIISFLDVKVTRKSDGTFDTEVYRKKTDSNIYLGWDSFSTRSWKIGTLKGLFRRAFLICSTESALEKEIKHLKHVFTKINGYPSKVVSNTLHEIRSKWNGETSLVNTISPIEPQNIVSEPSDTPYICLPYKGMEGEGVIKKFKNYLKDFLPDQIKPRFIYKGTKLGSFFSVKDKVDVKHQTDLVYGYTPKGEICLKKGYVGETNVRIDRRTQEHAKWDKASSVYKFSKENNVKVSFEDFQILEKGYPKYLDRKIAEALYVKEYSPKLSGQKLSYKLKLFN